VCCRLRIALPIVTNVITGTGKLTDFPHFLLPEFDEMKFAFILTLNKLYGNEKSKK